MTEEAPAVPGPEDLVVVGDVHLGRRPTGLDDALAGLGLSAREMSPAAALELLVDALLAHPPRAVLFAGDLVDEEKDRFEAYAVLQRAAERLLEAGIPVHAVAGNHDGLVLPRLTDRVEGVNLLGEGGRWQRVELAGPGRPIDLLGWSFPARHVRENPLDQASFQEVRGSTRAGASVIGLLHADLDASPGSSYAPVSRARLRDAGLDAWFVGHVHQPDDLRGPRPLGYLGSLVGLDAGEAGPRGAWRVQCSAEGFRARQLEHGPVRWDGLEVPLQEEHAVDADALHARLEECVRQRFAGLAEQQAQGLKLLVLRARLCGRLAERRAVREFAAGHEVGMGEFRLGGLPVLVERVSDRTRGAVDLEVLAQEPSPVGFVATRLLALERGKAGAALSAARARVRDVEKGGGWGLAEDDDRLPPPDPRQLAERAAWRVLDVLLQQRAELS